MLNTIHRAVAYREAIRAAGTDALRIVDGASDKLPGIDIDEFAGHWLVQTRDKKQFPDALATANQAGATYWKSSGESQTPLHINGPELRAPFVAHESSLQYRIDFNAGASQGLFIDQRDNRQRLRRLAPGRSLLNCFAYTCAFGVAAAASGATTTNVDLSKNYLAWGKRNYEVNGLDPAAHEFLHGDVFEWFRRFAKKGRKFDLIVLDPPTFSRGAEGKVFRVTDDFPALTQLASTLLSEAGVLFCGTNQHTLSTIDFERLIVQNLESGWHTRAFPMPSDFRGSHYLKSIWLSRAELPAGLG